MSALPMIPISIDSNNTTRTAGQPIPLSAPDVSARDRERVNAVLSGTTLSLGPLLPEFERAAAAAAGTRFAVAVNSGTSALHLCVKAAGFEEGDEVITTPFSFVASANCLLYERVIPRFVDIDPLTYNIDPAEVESAIGARTRGIVPVHVFGHPCDMPRINATAGRHKLTVIEDSCEAIGATINGQRAGSFGQSGVFAFYPNKQITTGEGGMVVTDDEAVARLCRSLRNQGRGEGGAWLQHERLGYNYRLSEINCALGLGQLSRLDEILAARKNVAAMYNEELSGMDGLVLPAPAAPGTEISWFVYVVRLQDDFRREDRDAVLQSLRNEGIGCNNYFSPIHLQGFYQEKFGFQSGQFPVTERVSARTIALPFFNALSREQVVLVGRALRRAIDSRARRCVSPQSAIRGMAASGR